MKNKKHKLKLVKTKTEIQKLDVKLKKKLNAKKSKPRIKSHVQVWGPLLFCAYVSEFGVPPPREMDN